MAGVTRSRRTAALVLAAVSRGRRLDLAFRSAADGLSPRDRRFVQELTYGTVRFRGRLDYLLDLHLRRGLGSVSGGILDLLRMGTYQLFNMDSVPPYAAISQTVDQVREVAGTGGARLANGVLRSLHREGGSSERFPDLETEPERHLATWGSHPRWLVRRWLRRWPVGEVADLVEVNNRPAPLYLRPLGATLQQTRSALSSKGWESQEVGQGVPCLRLEDGIDPAPLLQTVKGIVQDPGSAMVTVYADFPPGSVVGDLCAAPGGKALAVADGGSYVLAADRSFRRLRLVQENIARVGSRVQPVVALAQVPPFRELPGVLLDVPCSGTGTLRRHPDARWRLNEEMMVSLVKLQEEILRAGAALVPGGGVLVYSTCTLEAEENGHQIDSFLAGNPEFHLEPSEAAPSRFLNSKGYLSITPQATGFDGAFAARMVRHP